MPIYVKCVVHCDGITEDGCSCKEAFESEASIGMADIENGTISFYFENIPDGWYHSIYNGKYFCYKHQKEINR